MLSLCRVSATEMKDTSWHRRGKQAVFSQFKIFLPRLETHWLRLQHRHTTPLDGCRYISQRCCHNFVMLHFDIQLGAASERGTLSQLMFRGKHATDRIHGTPAYYHLHGNLHKNYDYVCPLQQNLPSGAPLLVTMFLFSLSLPPPSHPSYFLLF